MESKKVEDIKNHRIQTVNSKRFDKYEVNRIKIMHARMSITEIKK